MNLDKLKKLLIEKIKKDYKDDIAIVHIHGSYAYNETHDLSDLDLYMVPKTKKGYNLGTTFILEGIGIDFWPISWERLESIANHNEAMSSIVSKGEIVYYSSEKDLQRFEELKKIATDKSDYAKYLENASIQLDKTYKHFLNMEDSDSLSQARQLAIHIIYDISFAIAEINMTPIERGRKYLKEEILAMGKIPENFAKLYDGIFLGKKLGEIKSACKGLISNTEKLIKINKKLFNTGDFKKEFSGWYEELVQSYNKITHATKTGDIYNPLYAASEIELEFSAALERAGEKRDDYILPDLVDAYDPNNLENIYELSKIHKANLEKIIKDKGVSIRNFENIQEFESYLESL